MKTIKNILGKAFLAVCDILNTIRLWICLFFLGFAILFAPEDMKVPILNILEIYKRMIMKVSAELQQYQPKKKHLKIVEEEDEEK